MGSTTQGGKTAHAIQSRETARPGAMRVGAFGAVHTAHTVEILINGLHTHTQLTLDKRVGAFR